MVSRPGGRGWSTAFAVPCKEFTDASLLCVQISNCARVTLDEKQSTYSALGNLHATLQVLRRESQGPEAGQGPSATVVGKCEEEVSAEKDESNDRYPVAGPTMLD